MIRQVCLILGLLCAAFSIQDAAHGHALQPGYASLEQTGENTWQVYWRKPDVSGRSMPIDLSLPAGCAPQTGPLPTAREGAWEASWTAVCDGPLPGGIVSIPGLEKTQTDVLVRLSPLESTTVSLRLTAAEPFAIVPANPGSFDVFAAYAGLGFEHILEGWDHLLFVFALLVLIRDFWRLVGAVTAFTVAHSLTLAAATLGWITLPPAPVEAVIALSIVFLASEIALSRDGRVRLSQSAPWLVTFAFGLLHGPRLRGRPEGNRTAAVGQSRLRCSPFNVGVEAGQLAFVVAALAVLSAVSKLLTKGPLFWPTGPSASAWPTPIGSLSSFWLIERVLSFTAV